MPRELAFTSPPALPVAIGATTPVGQLGAEIWSTVAEVRLVWTGTQWADAMGGGNAATATALQTARTINGVSFDGTANITLPTVNTTGDQTVGGIKTFTSQIVASGGVQGNITGNAATVSTVTPGQLSPLVSYTTPTDASGYTWIRFEFTNGNSFNAGQQQIEFYVTRSIFENNSNPYGGCTAKFTAQGREWHGGQEMMVVQYGEHGSHASAGQGFYITHARVADLLDGGYWIYLRVRSGITYYFREALHGGTGCNFGSLQGSTDPGSGQPIFAGLNLISTGGAVNFYNNGNAVLHAGNVLVTSNTSGIGYGTGAGGTVTQATSKSTAVTLNRPTGQITLNNEALAANTTVQFIFHNSVIGANDVVLIQHLGGVANGISYNIWACDLGAGGCFINVRNITAGSLSDALQLQFVVIKGALS